MRITEAKIRKIIKEEIQEVINRYNSDPNPQIRFRDKTINMATNPEVRTKPQSGNVPSISRTDIKFNPNEPIKSLEDLVINNPQFRNILVSSVQSTGFVDIPTISNFIKNYFSLDQKRLDDVMEKVNSSGAIDHLLKLALGEKAVRENKRK